TDVDTARTGDFQNLPAGWATPAGGGLHLVTQYEVDGLGRRTKATDPRGNVTYTVYIDTNFEIRTYRGWQTATNRPTGPTGVRRDDRGNSYGEGLTMSAAPAVDGTGRPTGAEPVSGLQTLSRTYTGTDGRVTQEDSYFNLAGLTYSTSPNLGTEGTHFYRTRTGYDASVRKNRVQSATGTISRGGIDGQGRGVPRWAGPHANAGRRGGPPA